MKSGMKQTVIGEIPVEWEVVKLGETGRIVSGATPDTKVAEYWNGEIAWCTPTDITALKGKKYFDKTQKNISSLGLRNSSASLLPVGSLVICTRATLGDCAINLVPMTTNQGFKSIIPTADWDINFLYYLIHSSKDVIKRLASGSTFLEISKKAFENIDIPFPPLPEQQKIAEILSTLDEKMAVIDEQLAQTQELKKGLMQRLLTKGIEHTAFKDSPLGKIPESWEVVKLDDLIQNHRGITYGIVQPGSFDAEGVFLVRGKDYSRGWVRPDEFFKVSKRVEEPYKRARLKSNDILITIVGAGVGNLAIVPTWLDGANITQTTARIAINPESSDFMFYYYVLQSHIGKANVRNYEKGNAQPGLNLADVKKFLVPALPLPEQRQIAEILTTLDDKLQVLTNKKAQYQELKRGLMQQLLTGQRRVKLRQEEAVLA